MRLQALVSSLLPLMPVGLPSFDATAQTQAPPTAAAPIASLERYLPETSKKYHTLDARERQLLVMLATSAATTVDSGRCADRSLEVPPRLLSFQLGYCQGARRPSSNAEKGGAGRLGNGYGVQPPIGT